MNTIVADKNMVIALKQVRESAQICDTKGKVIGTFTPRQQRVSNHPKLASRFDLEAIERRKRAKEKAIPHREVMRHMRLLEAEIERRERAGERKLTGDEAAAFVRRLRTKGEKKQSR